MKVLIEEKDYQEALIRLGDVFDAIPGTKQGEELERLSILIQKYEDKHCYIKLPEPIEAIKFREEQLYA
ncbi:hypothetical protein HX052_10720 [Myroides marinus]|uniref:hypothetical protein n=1 Tax=Myroides marinus TaxID=703342 RepID=UPI0025791E67|nr:hypothetical protein [Myroides marinus]MDM1390431.1 hypothetical protein [Myroides marinus]MDM1404577.1 hypothetical protein [Myroides marinus]